ncbi:MULTISPECIES: AMP-binding protein [Microbacterium]|uniref:Acyl-CoA synthetase n=1 Tax=Microbacterium wangchenii TaxID=2541726 RepID=A0ABX5SUJ9_9MICO|nr:MULTISPECIES: AMP-binding protein [Microbacterium]MCK6067213.1 AMP-binding protein [Microbacterium sp. EYE_512]QBR89834.1 acyl-CoA synthetase [Microbacterium wangchenii]TXK16568.1 AMP-binding protein [Microbacterium wangchenii]
MRLEQIDAADPRDVLRALRAALGAGPAVGFGSTRGQLPAEVPAGTAVVVTTSGSTGVPKAVALSRSALTSSALATSARIGEGAWLLALPPAYVAGVQVLVRSLIAGREPAILSGSFSPTSFAAAARLMTSTENGVRVPTYTSLVPVQLQRVLDAAASDRDVADALQSFEAILVGGQSLPDALRERAADAGARIVRTYGSTETCGGCVYDGAPLDGVRIRVVGGEVQITGPVLADGYLGEPGRTAAVFPTDPDGTRWYRTGDAGLVDEHGLLRIHGRIDNVIVSGGVNISLDRVEQVVRSIRGLESAVVVPVADPQWGEASVIVAPRGDALRRSEAEQLEHARTAVAAELGAPARPSRLIVVDELDSLPSGKPDREAIRRLVASLH